MKFVQVHGHLTLFLPGLYSTGHNKNTWRLVCVLYYESYFYEL